jgi:patatin-like phospholipase/acyl hydrolase
MIFWKFRLKELIKPCLITSYDIENRRAKLFNSWEAHLSTDNFYVKDVCRATSAAPTYFSPVQIKSMYGQIFSLIDGGMFANNPALCAYAEAKNSFCRSFEKSSESESSCSKRYDYYFDRTELKQDLIPSESCWKNSWVSPIIDILMSANAETVDYQLCQMFQTLVKKSKKLLSPESVTEKRFTGNG